jgi:hypothetical protein
MGTQRGQIKGVLSWLVCWACVAGTRAFCSALAALVGYSRKRKSKREARKVGGEGGGGLIPTKAHKRSFLSVIP